MSSDYSKKNLQKIILNSADLSYAKFIESNLRGAGFTGYNLTGANFTHAKKGITPGNTILIFFATLTVSLLSGYIAILAGHKVQQIMFGKAWVKE